jgi:hypothetical protein
VRVWGGWGGGWLGCVCVWGGGGGRGGGATSCPCRHGVCVSRRLLCVSLSPIHSALLFPAVTTFHIVLHDLRGGFTTDCREDELHRGQVRHNDDGILDALLLFRRRGAQVRAVRFVWTQQPAAVCRHDACSSSSGCQQCQTQCCRHMACSPTSSVLPCHTTGAAAAGGAVYPGCQPGAAGTHRGHPLPWPRGDAAPLHVRSSGPALSSELDPRLAWLLGCWAVRSGCCWSCQHQERLLKRELSAAA